ncbi:SDR family NAD(P)-dependent oxidoreductase [Glaciecola petra]|uniref:SDR family oxidoreductase n=1 Tax=Glaciecola petra TaxID=3075602 RepID=A0ABU2ZN75_9ALTE|nr:SDR family oxidoreductase [Aestuariibacter sp. P117]MDT0594078.1 SDR family oxidoreductase [Aestuariibacter sp. P117]
MDPLLNFENQTAIITGAASGFGRALAIALNQRACQLVLSDIDESGLEQTRKLLTSPEKCKTLIVNVASEEGAETMVKKALDAFGSLTIAVNNAGVAHKQAAIHDLSGEIFDNQFDINVKGVAFGMKHQIRAMLQQGSGHILNVSSMAGIGGAPKGGAYSAAKHAVVGLTRTAAVEYGRYNVRCNAICPFFSPTDILEKGGMGSEENKAKLGIGSPMKRISKIEEIVNVMLLTLSPGNTYMNGQTIAVDGGVSAW